MTEVTTYFYGGAYSQGCPANCVTRTANSQGCPANCVTCTANSQGCPANCVTRTANSQGCPTNCVHVRLIRRAESIGMY